MEILHRCAFDARPRRISSAHPWNLAFLSHLLSRCRSLSASLRGWIFPTFSFFLPTFSSPPKRKSGADVSTLSIRDFHSSFPRNFSVILLPALFSPTINNKESSYKSQHHIHFIFHATFSLLIFHLPPFLLSFSLTLARCWGANEVAGWLCSYDSTGAELEKKFFLGVPVAAAQCACCLHEAEEKWKIFDYAKAAAATRWRQLASRTTLYLFWMLMMSLKIHEENGSRWQRAKNIGQSTRRKGTRKKEKKLNSMQLT